MTESLKAHIFTDTSRPPPPTITKHDFFLLKKQKQTINTKLKELCTNYY